MAPPISLSLYSELYDKFLKKCNKDTKLKNTSKYFDCDILFSNYVKCLNDHNTHCENIHKQFEKCLYFHQPRFD